MIGLMLLAMAANATPELRVCADPNNLPFSNAAGEGFENKIVEIVAAELGMRVSYTWWAQRRGNIRETLNEKKCDLIPGIGSNVEMLATTRPYYRSTYVAVTRPGLVVRSFDDPRLKTLRIGVQMIGDDFSNTPPAHALEKRGIVQNVRGYMLYGDYLTPSPQAGIIDGVAKNEIDIAFAWGPVAGYFSTRAETPLTLTPVQPPFDGPQLPMLFDISMGARKTDVALRNRVDGVLRTKAAEIRRILESYKVPLVP